MIVINLRKRAYSLKTHSTNNKQIMTCMSPIRMIQMCQSQLHILLKFAHLADLTA